MKKVIPILSALMIMIAGPSCAQNLNQNKKGDNMSKKALVVYYSYSGNTKEAARLIQREMSADIFEIQTVKAYPSTYNEVTTQAKKEINEGYKPAIKDSVENIAQYDIIFIGSPIWWGTLAPAVNTFLAQHDLAGKTVVPFVTHGGGGAGRSFSDLKKSVPGAVALNIGSFYGSSATQKDIAAWLKEIKIK